MQTFRNRLCCWAVSLIFVEMGFESVRITRLMICVGLFSETTFREEARSCTLTDAMGSFEVMAQAMKGNVTSVGYPASGPGKANANERQRRELVRKAQLGDSTKAACRDPARLTPHKRCRLHAHLVVMGTKTHRDWKVMTAAGRPCASGCKRKPPRATRLLPAPGAASSAPVDDEVRQRSQGSVHS